MSGFDSVVSPPASTRKSSGTSLRAISSAPSWARFVADSSRTTLPPTPISAPLASSEKKSAVVNPIAQARFGLIPLTASISTRRVRTVPM